MVSILPRELSISSSSFALEVKQIAWGKQNETKTSLLVGKTASSLEGRTEVRNQFQKMNEDIPVKALASNKQTK